MSLAPEMLAAFAPVDAQLALLLGRLGADDDTALAAALCGHWRGLGHSCLPLARMPRTLIGPEGGIVRLPPAERLRQALERSPWVAREVDPGRPQPLVLHGDRLYLWRYFLAEGELAAAIAERLARPARAEVAARLEELAPLWSRLFPKLGDEPDLQARAARGALEQALFLITGGPGTGKTRTVARLAAAAATLQPGLRLRLAAPTGKAAQRLDETLDAQWQQLGAELGGDFHLPRRPEAATTLHRLLGYQPRLDQFSHRAGNPLAVDLLVVDEASMVDLLLMKATFAALPAEAKVVLLGDRDQLASVETGAVFADLTGEDLAGEAEGPLAGHAVVLQRSHRFADRPGIAALSAALRAGDAEAAWRLLERGGDDLGHQGAASDDPARLLEPLAPGWRRYLASASPGEALGRLGELRLLCALRQGPWGVDGLNAAVERLLIGHHPTPSPSGAWYQGRPILIRANDYDHELYNGDLGVVWREAGQLWAFFDEGRRRLPLARLPRHDSAWAMTVHQSQGSEFDHVLLVLPPREHPLLNRELLYTAVTRARRRVDVVVGFETLAAALARSARRESGLVGRLAAARARFSP